MSDYHLRFAPEILRRLGEELIPHPDLGIIELVRNAYDADADACTISLYNVNSVGGEVIVSDNGDGMTVDQIRTGWLLLGRSSKVASRFTQSGRRRVGEKGLGRLGALRLGSRADLVTRPKTSTADDLAREEIQLQIDWDDFERVEAVEDVALNIDSLPIEPSSSGTTISLQNLRHRMSSQDVRRLARSLLLMTGPFPADNQFRATLNAPEFVELEKLVEESYFGEHEYRVVAEVDENGYGHARLENWRGQTLGEADHRELHDSRKPNEQAEPYRCPPSFFELFHFNLSKAGFDVRGSKESFTTVQEWLKVVGGVHLFQRNLRVQPYGDPGHDWLDMNLRRVRSPELRPSTNNAVGRVVVNDDLDLLVPKTDRTGFLENEAFLDLQRFGGDVLEWAADVRTKLRDKKREQDRDRARETMNEATSAVNKTVKNLPEQVRPKVERALEQYQEAVGRQLRSVEDDLLLYRTLGTVGTTTAVFAHETLRPVATIESIAQSLQFRIQRDLPDKYESRYASALARVGRSATSLRTFAEIPLRMLSRRRRRHTVFDLNLVVSDVLDLFEPYVSAGAVKIEGQLSEVPSLTSGSIASAEAILANLIANSVYFFGAGAEGRDKVIIVRTTVHRRSVVLTVADSGPGLQGIEPNDVWLPGRTTREEGTGLGLTIVRDSVRDMGGTATCVSPGELGGADFLIELPLSEEQPTDLALGEKGVGGS